METKTIDELKGSLGEIKTLVEKGNTTIADQGKKIIDLETTFKAGQDDTTKLRADLDKFRKQQLAAKSQRSGPVRPGQVSDECAKHIAARICLQAESIGALEKGGMDSHRRDALVAVSREILGMEVKAALTSSDIPLPTEFGGEVVELVSAFGAARMYGTVYPLGTGTVKLPRLGTDPTFALIAASGAVPEKVPTVVFVTFTPEKFGGLVRIPSELDADSIVPLGQFVARYCARQIAYLEDYNFFASTGAGSGTNGSVKGLTVSRLAANDAKSTVMAATKTHYSDATLANLRDMRAVVDSPVLQRAAYFMHPTFEKHLAGLNTAGDKPYNPQAQIAGTGANPFIAGATLDGFPIRWVDAMPAFSTGVNASKIFALFGDPSFQYLGIRQGISMDMSKDVYFATDELGIRCLERFTIGLMATGAVSGLETAAA